MRIVRGLLHHKLHKAALLFLVVGLSVECRGPLNLSNIPAPITPFKPVTNRVILVVLENQKFNAIIGNPRAPYLNSLAQRYAVAGNYFANTHPSIGDYFMLTTGQIISNDLVFEGIIQDDNIVRELGQHSMDWKAYAQSIPQPGYTGDRSYPYAKTHVPFAYFADIVAFPSQALKMVGTDGLLSDVALDAMPAFVYITPDQLHNMHDCSSGVPKTCTNDDKIADGDAWLQQTLDPIINSPTFAAHNTLLLITWDESFDKDFENGGGHIPFIVVSPDVKPGYVSTTFFQHQSALRLLEERLGLPVELGASEDAPSMQEFFQTPAAPGPPGP
jgi:phosphatidylinositol-3-phosphatase